GQVAPDTRVSTEPSVPLSPPPPPPPPACATCAPMAPTVPHLAACCSLLVRLTTLIHILSQTAITCAVGSLLWMYPHIVFHTTRGIACTIRSCLIFFSGKD